MVISSSRDSSDAGFSRAAISVASTVTTMAPPRARFTPAATRSSPQREAWAPVTTSSLPFLEDLPDDGAPAAARAPATAPAPARRLRPAGPAPPPPRAHPAARPAPAVLAVGRGVRRPVLARAVGGEEGDAEERVSRRHLLDGGRREPSLPVQLGERPRPVEQALAELRAAANAEAARFERAAAATLSRSAWACSRSSPTSSPRVAR